jgi:predicted ATP-grasp superfamily ATP-dependent carboligase
LRKGEPVATVLTSGNILEDTIYSAKRVVNGVYENLKPTL